MRICTISGCDKKYCANGYCEMHRARYRRHGSPYITKGHGMSTNPIYDTWCTMIQRCTNPNNAKYKIYGERGIKVCYEWRKAFLSFYKDMGEKPDGMQIDRIDNNGDYTPENCRWTTSAENNRNKRNNVLSIKKANKIRLLYKKGMYPKEISKIMEIKHPTIESVIYHNAWEEK
ncbi:hypothetical protein LCGC14_0364530 [marine sediment metagenome]|uniref:HNH nuclease domain-containing protein n=1 Tax=marine sediment metagenome TaxID=412755 RepID=A0A0F9VU29_9ZZZZ